MKEIVRKIFHDRPAARAWLVKVRHSFMKIFGQFISNNELNLKECHKLPLCMRSRPILIYAEICTHCNMSCSMCGRSVHGVKDSDTGYMTREVYEKLSGLFSSGGTLGLFGRGETLLHPEFNYFLEIAKKKGMKVSFNSNGKALTKEIAQAMVEFGQDSLTISCSAGTPETYEKIHRGGKWDDLWQNISYLFEAKKEKYGSRLNGKPGVYLEFVAQMDNIRELPQLVRRAYEWGFTGVLVIDMVAHSEELKTKRVNIPENIPIAEKCYEETLAVQEELKDLNPNFDLRLPTSYNALTKKFAHSSEQEMFEELNSDLEQKTGCGSNDNMCIEPWQTFYVRFNGDIAPCVITNRSLGDLNKLDAEKIWNGSDFQKFRKRMRSESKPFECLRCHLFPGPQIYDKALDDPEQYEPL